MEEIWKDIKGYEGIYQVSNFGDVKSNERYVYRSNGKAYVNALIKEKILKKSIRQGYYAVKLYKGGKKKNIPIHRLVAETFIERVANKSYINHKDGNKLNNNVNNLEWCTCSENIKHAYRIGLAKITEKQKENWKRAYKLGNEKNSKKVNQFDLQGNFIKQWDSINEANRYFGKIRTRINDVCKGRYKQCMGYRWEYVG